MKSVSFFPYFFLLSFMTMLLQKRNTCSNNILVYSKFPFIKDNIKDIFHLLFANLLLKGNLSLTYILAYMKVIHFKNRMLSSFFSQWSHEGRILRITIRLASPYQPLLAAMFSNCYQLWLNEWHCHFLPPLSEQWIIDCSALHKNSLRNLH